VLPYGVIRNIYIYIINTTRQLNVILSMGMYLGSLRFGSCCAWGLTEHARSQAGFGVTVRRRREIKGGEKRREEKRREEKRDRMRWYRHSKVTLIAPTFV